MSRATTKHLGTGEHPPPAAALVLSVKLGDKHRRAGRMERLPGVG